MHLLITSCLLIVCGFVDAGVIIDQRRQSLNQLLGRRVRSTGLIYPFEYQYNAIEPSIDTTFKYTSDSGMNVDQPIHQLVEMTNRDAYSFPKTYSYHSKSPIYDSDFISVQEVPRLMPEDSYDYKYLTSPWEKYRSRPLAPENDIAVNLITLKNTIIESPTYQSPYASESVLNFDSKILSTILKDSQPLKTDSEISKVSSPSVIIVQLLPEPLEQESRINIEKTSDLIFKDLLTKLSNEAKTPKKDELNSITEKTPSADELDSLVSKLFKTFPNRDESSYITIEENPTENPSNSIKTEETLTVDELDSLVSKLLKTFPTRDESSSIATEENPDENKLVSSTIEQMSTGDESNSMITEENSAKNEFIFSAIEDDMSKDESNSVKIEENPTKNEFISTTVETEDESNSITEENPTKNEFIFSAIEDISTEDESNPVITEENPTKNEFISTTIEQISTEDESKSIITEKILTVKELNSLASRFLEVFPTRDESISIETKENPTENEFITSPIEQMLTEDESNSITSQDTTKENFEFEQITTKELLRIFE